MKDKILFNLGKWYAEYDEDGNCTKAYYDEGYCRLLGVDAMPDDTDSDDIWKTVIHPDDLAVIEKDTTELFGKHPEGMDYDIEYRMLVDSEYRWFHDFANCTRREDGSISRMDGVIFDVQDIVDGKKAEKELEQTNERLFALEDNFEVLYDVELDTGHYSILVKGQFFGDVTGNFINNNSFFDDVEKNLDAVYPEDRQGNYDTTRPEFIRDVLSKDDHFDRYYRLLVDGKPAWAKMRIVYKNEEKKNIIIGVFNADNDVEVQQIAEQKAKLEESLTFTNYFLNTYITAYYINLDTKGYKVYKGPVTEMGKKALVGNDYLEGLTVFFKKVVHPDDLDELVSIIQPENLKEQLKRGEVSYTFRDVRDGGEKLIRMQAIRGAEENQAALGFRDVTEEMEEQQKRLLGAIPLSSDVLIKANIGLWAFELDEGKPPRMYGDEAMLKLVGLDHQVTPEEMYHAWYDYIDEGSYGLVLDAVEKMASGDHAEVQYPWHYQDGRTIVVRCGGTRNFEYTKGIRIEGTHQDVTETIHFDEEVLERAKQNENELVISKLRADMLAYIEDNDPDLDKAIRYFGNRILEIFDCDQIVYREPDGRRIILNAPGIQDISHEICDECPFARFDSEVFKEDGPVIMNDSRLGFNGVMTAPDCPVKSSFMQMVYAGGEIVGKLTIHYLEKDHVFTDNGVRIMKIVAIYLGLLIGRVNEKKAEKARLMAESSNKAKTEFLFNMSHDIRTPMNAILGYTDIALNHVSEQERVQDSLIKIKTSGGHLLRLINDILEMSRIEAGKFELNVEPVNAYDVTEGVVNMSSALADKKDITFKATIGDLKNPYVYADELHTNQVIINLISNAIKYTSPGGKVDYCIHQISDPVDGIANYRITVRDNGIGMSEEFQEHLFESFSREESATASQQEGAGLGLAIVKRILDIIGGTISVKSKKGKGSTFVVELPLKVMDDAAIEEYETARGKMVELGEEPELEGKKVLLVEDNEMNREIAAEILEEIGLAVETAVDGDIAVKKVVEKGCDYYDFILMDIQMPVMDGYEATAEIRKLQGGHRIPIIALSANAFAEDVEKSLDAGMNAHVAKPIDVPELIRTMESLKRK